MTFLGEHSRRNVSNARGACGILFFAWAFNPGLGGQVNAQESGYQGVLEEIIVTARRREENLQELPISAAVVTAATMQAEGIYSVEQVGEFVPNLTLASGDRANHTRIIIRGIGGGNPDPVFPIGTGMYIDGHYIPNSVGGYLSTLDIDRVEVLRGPQGTLFGKNTTGGAINIISTKPAPEFAASLSARIGEFGEQHIRGMVNFPISENVFARVSAANEQSDGYYYNRHLSINADSRDHTTLTAALRFTPGDHWTIDTSLSYAENRDGEKGGQCAPGPEPWARGRATRYGDDENQTQTYAICRTDNSFGPFVNSSGKRAFSNVETEGVFALANWDSMGEFGGLDSLNVKASASYRNMEYRNLHDRDYMELLLLAIGTGPGGPRYTLTRGAEVLVEGVVNDRLVFVTGVHYFYEETQTGDARCYWLFVERFDPSNPDVDIPCEPMSGLVIESTPARGFIFGGITGVYNTSVGVFGHLTYDLNERWELAAGLRYTEDEREFISLESRLQNVQIPDSTALATFDTILNDATVNQFGALTDGKDTFSDVTPMISLTRALKPGEVLDSGMFYLRYAEGFLTGGFNAELNLRRDPLLEPLQSYGPEHVDNYEFGFKGTFADGRLRFNTAVFYMDYTDKQDAIIIDNSDGRFIANPNVLEFSAVTNVSAVEIYGLELELRAQPWRGGLISFDLGYLHNEYGEYDSLDDDLNLLDLSSLAISDLSPDWTVNWKIEHRFMFANGATVTPMLGVYWQSEYEWLGGLDRDSPPSFCFQGDYAKWRTRLTYESAAGGYQVSLYGNNISDELIYEHCRVFNGLYVYRHAQPAAWGVEFSGRWGG